MKAVIMAGGKGTRLASITKNEIPKPMVELNGKPLLKWQIEQLRRYGINDITLMIGFLGEVIEKYFGASVKYVREEKPLGSAGALYYLRNKDNAVGGAESGASDDTFVLLMGDLFFDIDFNRMIKFHKEKGALVTLLAHPNAHPQDSDLIITDEDGRVTGFDSKHNVRDYFYDNLVNAGIFIMDKRVLEYIKKPEKMNLENDLLAHLINDTDEKIYAYRTPEFVRDVGTPERIEATARDLESGLIPGKNLEKKQKAIFLDRDGTINKFKGFINDPNKFELEDNAAEAVRMINESGYLAVVVTNQPVIARGECSVETLNEIHKKMKTLLGKEGAFVDDILYCPHHPDKGFEGEVVELKIDCDCRKPKTGMLKEAAERWNIDLNNSWVIGDGTIDIKMANNAGCKSVLVKTGVAGEDKKFPDAVADFIEDDLLSAVRRILK